MKNIERAIIQIVRNWGKTLILFLLLFLLSVLSASAILVRHAILTTDENLRRQLPAIATISQDILAHELANQYAGVTLPVDAVRATMIREIGALPYVRQYDYTSWRLSFFSDDLFRTFEWYSLLEAELIDFQSLRVAGLDFENFVLKGVQNPLIADIEAGLIDLFSGRVFTEEEIELGSPVVLVSNDFAIANNLQLGDVLDLEYRIYYERAGTVVVEEHFSADNMLGSELFSLEIIGIFDYEFVDPGFPDMMRIFQYFNIINQFYVPNRLIESTIDLYFDVFFETNPDILGDFLTVDNIEDAIQHEHMIFLLYDPVYLLAFGTAANEILPEFWVISDLSNAYANITTSMELLRDVSDSVLAGTIVAMVLTVSLLLALIIRDRYGEIVVYLALGQTRMKIIGQILLEVYLVAILAIFSALLFGNVFGNEISTMMLRHEMANQVNQPTPQIRPWNSPEALGFRFEISPDEMLENYEVRLNVNSVIIFVGLKVAILSVTTILPVVLILRLRPKEVLMMKQTQF